MRPLTTYRCIVRRVSSKVAVPRASWSATYASHSASAQISPALWTSELRPVNCSGWVVGSSSSSETMRNVKAFFVMSVEYGARRRPKYGSPLHA